MLADSLSHVGCGTDHLVLVVAVHHDATELVSPNVVVSPSTSRQVLDTSPVRGGFTGLGRKYLWWATMFCGLT